MKFSGIKQPPRPPKPIKVIKLTPDDFEITWPKRPQADVAVGLRRRSVETVMRARLEAEREATGVYDEHPPGVQPMTDVLVEQYNDILLCNLLAEVLCDPNDARVPYFDDAIVTIRAAVTSEALRKIYDEFMLVSIGAGAIHTPATDEELVLLGRALRSPVGRRALGEQDRKLCSYLLEQLRDAMPDTPDDDGTDDLFDAVTDDEEDAIDGFMSGGETVHVGRAD